MRTNDIVTIIVLYLVFFLILIFTNKENESLVIKEEHVAIVDSVWFTSPGQENTLQTDYHYYGRLTNGQVIKSSDKAFQIGDSIQYIYYRYENTKKEKKH
jgi:hypothetical protein